MKKSKTNHNSVSRHYPRNEDMQVYIAGKGRKMKNNYRDGGRHAKQLGLFEAWRVRQKGIHDGRLNLPRIDGAGNWTSPFIQKELDVFGKFSEQEWRRCEKALEAFHIEAERLDFQLGRLKERFQSVPDVRYPGEEALADWIVQQRRTKERSQAEVTAERFRVLMSQIMFVEDMTRLHCQEARCHAMGRISIYWDGCLASHSIAESLPPAPLLPLYKSAEETYMKQHRLSAAFADRQTGEEDYYA